MSNPNLNCNTQNLILKNHISPSAVKDTDDRCLGPSFFRKTSPTRFPATPSSFLGNLFHKLIEDAGNGIDPKKNIKNLRKEELCGVSAKKVFPSDDKRGWFAKKKIFLKIAEDSFRPDATPPPKNDKTVHRPKSIDYQNFEIPLKEGVYFEQPIALHTMGIQLYGFMDKIIVTSNSVTIIDFKTGSMTDKNGSIKPGYRLQMLTYGFMASKIYKSHSIFLKLIGIDHFGSHKEESIYFDETSVKRLIKSLSRKYQDSKTKEDLRPGSDCRWCSLRTDCMPYHDAVENEKWWLGAEYEIPLDIWGTITSIEDSGRDGYKHLKIDTPIGPYEVHYIPEQTLSDKNKTEHSFIEIYGLYNPNEKYSNPKLPRRMLIAPSDIHEPWNQSFSYIVL